VYKIFVERLTVNELESWIKTNFTELLTTYKDKCVGLDKDGIVKGDLPNFSIQTKNNKQYVTVCFDLNKLINPLYDNNFLKLVLSVDSETIKELNTTKDISVLANKSNIDLCAFRFREFVTYIFGTELDITCPENASLDEIKKYKNQKYLGKSLEESIHLYISLACEQERKDYGALLYENLLNDGSEPDLDYHEFDFYLEKYSDYSTLSLKDVEELNITNNDTLQHITSKINMANEALTVICTLSFGSEGRQDTYTLYNHGTGKKYIKYICPSTGRVYYDEVIESNLNFSKLYKKGDNTSIIKAWWSILHLGADPDKANVIRC